MATSLKDFVADTLEEIVAGVHEAQARTFEEFGARINPAFFHAKEKRFEMVRVEFDVAVAAGETKKSGGGAGISVVGLGGGGAHSTTERQSSNVSRIKFSVPLVLPPELERPKSEAPRL